MAHLAYVLVDVLLVVVLARLLGNLAVRLGQPRVVGEIVAGLALGPTLLGAPLAAKVVPLDVRPTLNTIAMLGLILFMFLAGLQFDLEAVRGRSGRAALLAMLSVLVPALLAFPLALVMDSAVYVGPAGRDGPAFALFLGAALAVTAFPVMAHILMERGELNSPLGALAVATAAFMSVFMFGYLAVAGAVVSSEGLGAVALRAGALAAVAVFSIRFIRPWLRRLMPLLESAGPVPSGVVAGAFGGLLLYALVAHLLGIHALVGGFAWGLLIPSTRVRQELASKITDVALILLLPVFFAMSGVAADLRLLDAATVPATLLLLAVAVGSKFIAVLPARRLGLGWSEVGVLGALTNTRGLLVLVAGLIGLDLEIITRLTFTMIVVVALVTNLMTLPILRAVGRVGVTRESDRTDARVQMATIGSGQSR